MSDMVALLTAIGTVVVTVGSFIVSIFVGRHQRRAENKKQDVDMLRMQAESLKDLVTGLERDRDYHQEAAAACYQDRDAVWDAAREFAERANELRTAAAIIIQHLASQVRELGGTVSIAVTLPSMPIFRVLYEEIKVKSRAQRREGQSDGKS